MPFHKCTKLEYWAGWKYNRQYHSEFLWIQMQKIRVKEIRHDYCVTFTGSIQIGAGIYDDLYAIASVSILGSGIQFCDSDIRLLIFAKLADMCVANNPELKKKIWDSGITDTFLSYKAPGKDTYMRKCTNQKRISKKQMSLPLSLKTNPTAKYIMTLDVPDEEKQRLLSTYTAPKKRMTLKFVHQMVHDLNDTLLNYLNKRIDSIAADVSLREEITKLNERIDLVSAHVTDWISAARNACAQASQAKTYTDTFVPVFNKINLRLETLEGKRYSPAATTVRSPGILPFHGIERKQRDRNLRIFRYLMIALDAAESIKYPKLSMEQKKDLEAWVNEKAQSIGFPDWQTAMRAFDRGKIFSRTDESD
jgi:hypothetical protein